MRERFIKLIENKKLFKKGDSIVMGVSGGADSMAMLHLFYSIREEYELHLHVVHLNHMFRGKDADADEEYVKEMCIKWDIECFTFKKNISEIAKENRICFEDAGRNERYGLFEKIRKKTKSQKIAVAQNKNDQTETVLMHFFRGAGLEGLTGIEFLREDFVIRPVMIFLRWEIEKYCEENGIIPRVDKTNFQSDYRRNKIRLELIPYIEKNINPQIIDSIFRSTELLSSDKKFIVKVVEKEYCEIAKEMEGKVVLDIEKLNSLDYAIKSRIIRKSIKYIKGNLKEVAQSHVFEILDLVHNNRTGNRKILFDKIHFLVSYGELIVCKEETFGSFKKGKLEIIETTIDKLENYNLGLTKIAIDKDKVKGDILIRNRLPGDKFIPIGASGSKKLKDFFIDMKIQREKRDLIPVICDAEDIIWVVGFRQDERFKIERTTSKVLILQYYQL